MTRISLADPRCVALARELRTLTRWLRLDSITFSPRGNLSRPLTSALG